MHARQTERRSEQTGRLGRKLKTRRVRGAHDKGETVEGRGVQSEFLDHHIERAEIATMAPKNLVFDIERRRPKPMTLSIGGRVMRPARRTNRA